MKKHQAIAPASFTLTEENKLSPHVCWQHWAGSLVDNISKEVYMHSLARIHVMEAEAPMAQIPVWTCGCLVNIHQ